jgi:hypothetical protein
MSRRARLQWRRSPRAGDGNRPAAPWRGCWRDARTWRKDVAKKTPQRGHSHTGSLRTSQLSQGSAGL